MHTDHGIFIVIEGSDGSGKKTQFDRLAERLTREGYEVVTFDFPQYDEPSSYFVREYLNGHYGSSETVGPYTASLFYALDRFEAAPKIREALEQGKIVLSNRYVGSNMAHQGTKFIHAAERRGFFIWLDNLEFEMLKIPRPTLSFVLHVPAETAQALIDQKEERSYTSKKRDIHEGDIDHLRRAVEVFDDLCQLFPKDFSRIDCARGDKLLDIDTVHELLWQKVTPMLPLKSPKPAKEVAAARVAPPNASISKQPDVQPPGKPQKMSLSITSEPAEQFELKVEHASHLLVPLIEQVASVHAFVPPTIIPTQPTAYYVPDHLPDNVKKEYKAGMNQLLSQHAAMQEALVAYLEATAETPAVKRTKDWHEAIKAHATTTLGVALPLATTQTLHLTISAQIMETLASRLLESNLHEAKDLGRLLITEARQVLPDFLKDAHKEAKAEKTTANLAAIAQANFSALYTTPPASVQLVDSWPRNELDLTAHMLYEYTDLPLKELQSRLADWPYEQKLQSFEGYLRDVTTGRSSGQALERAHYTWDLLCDYRTFCELRRHGGLESFARQELTPRYGFEVSPLIEDAGLSDQFEACFDLSLRLHSLVQEAGYRSEAEYATLLGHKVRCKGTYTAREATQLFRQKAASEAYEALVRGMQEKLAEVHPVLGEFIK